MDTSELIRRAESGLKGNHPEHDFPVPGGASEAGAGYALLALVAEQRSTNWHLNGIADSLSRIAKALEQGPESVAPPEPPKRRLWLPTRRRTGD